MSNELEKPLLTLNDTSDDFSNHIEVPSKGTSFKLICQIHFCIRKANSMRLTFNTSTNYLKDALENVDKAYKLAKKYPLVFCREFPLVLKLRGDIKRLMGDFLGALSDLNEAHKLAPTDKFILKARGVVKIAMADYDGALVDLDEANKVAPNDSYTLKIRGDVKKRMGDYVGALKDLNKADKLIPNDNFTLQIRGRIKEKLNDDKGALADLDKAKKLKYNCDIFTLKFRIFN